MPSCSMKLLRPIFMGALLLASCAATPRPTTDPSHPDGRALASRVCAGCHALAAGEESPNPRAPPFPSREMQHTAGLAGRVADLARLGHQGMPPIPLSAAEAAAVTAYIESLGETPPPAKQRY